MTAAGPSCPLTGQRGRARRRLARDQLLAAYSRWHGVEVPPHLVERYFPAETTEYESGRSGLRWYEPALLGGPDFYAWLEEAIPGYSTTGSWDKREALRWLESAGCRTAVEIGCGRGWLLEAMAERGIDAVGADENPAALRHCRERGLAAHLPAELPAGPAPRDALVLLQTLEHVARPAAFLRGLLDRHPARQVVLSMPCHDALIGYTTAPLSWPPHHFTSWSARSIRVLSGLLGLRVAHLAHDDECDVDTFRAYRKCEPGGRFAGLPGLPPGRLGWCVFHALRALGVRFAVSRHSVLAVLERPG